MIVILVYVALVVVGQAIAMSIATVVEQTSAAASVIVFFALFATTFVVAWYAAVYICERYLTRFVSTGPQDKQAA